MHAINLYRYIHARGHSDPGTIRPSTPGRILFNRKPYKNYTSVAVCGVGAINNTICHICTLYQIIHFKSNHSSLCSLNHYASGLIKYPERTAPNTCSAHHLQLKAANVMVSHALATTTSAQTDITGGTRTGATDHLSYSAYIHTCILMHNTKI